MDDARIDALRKRLLEPARWRPWEFAVWALAFALPWAMRPSSAWERMRPACSPRW